MLIKIENCYFAFQCPKKWEELRKTKDTKIRYCDTCAEQVYFCDSILELEDAIQNGRCVAFEANTCCLGRIEEFSWEPPIE